MREIKFRMWNPCRRDGKGGYHYGKQAMDCLTQQSIGLYDHEKDGSVFEQFTGLHDKTGKEIYFRSDIVEATIISEYDGSETKISGVLFVDLKRFKISMQGYEDFNLMFADELEIIDNIHENPELINER